MKRAIALAGAMMALLVIGATSASAAGVCTPGTPQYCPAPSVAATGATAIGTGSATLNGTINSNAGGPANWVISINGGVVASGTIPDGSTNVPVSATVGGLTAGSTYTYTVSITNYGSTTSSNSTFTTVALPTEQPSDTPSTPTTSPSTDPTPPNNTSPSTNPTTTEPTAAEKREAAGEVKDTLGKGTSATYSTEIGGALVFDVSGAKASPKTGTPVLALTIPDGAEVKAAAPAIKAGGKSITPKVTTTVKDGVAVVSVKLTGAQTKALSKAGKSSISVTVTVTGDDGKPVQKNVTVKLPKKGK